MFFLSNLCFLCLGTSKSVLIENRDEMLVDMKLKYCLPEMDVDFQCEIPKYICSNCLSKLEYLYKFKQTCLRNNTYMKSYLQTLTSAGKLHKHLSVKLNVVKYQNKLQPVSSDQTFATVGSDELQTEEKKNKKQEDDMKCDDGESHLLLKEKDAIVVKEEFLISEDKVDNKFYLGLVKSIKCELIPSNSDLSVSRIEDISYEEDKYCNTDSDSENNLTKSVENKVIEENKLQKSIKVQCTICSREYLNKKSLKNHLKSHAEVKRFSCTICKKKFMLKCHLIQHETVHTGIKKYKCLTCEKKFTQKCNLTKHKEIHTGMKNYECLICRRKFMQKAHLIRHETFHTDIKNYECSICKKKFALKFNLNQHEKLHSGIKKYECSRCKKKFTYEYNLKQHEKFHTGIKNYQCLMCKKTFMAKKYLIQHEKIHTDRKKYECSICEKKYMRKGHLIRHAIIHMDNKNLED